jgi:hypothetical protein
MNLRRAGAIFGPERRGRSSPQAQVEDIAASDRRASLWGLMPFSLLLVAVEHSTCGRHTPPQLARMIQLANMSNGAHWFAAYQQDGQAWRGRETCKEWCQNVRVGWKKL